MSTITEVRYLGHSAVFLRIIREGQKELVVAIDPWLEGNPLCPPELKNPGQIDYIILSHGHADHASDVPRLAKSTGAKVLATYELAMILGGEGVPEEQLLAMNKGGSVLCEGIRFQLEQAFHSSSFDSSDRGTLYAGEACSVLIEIDGKSIFHAGDTALFSDMARIGASNKIDLAFLPIGDRFTMGAKDAAEAASLLQAVCTIPIHYKTFPMLAQDAEAFAVECERRAIAMRELVIGEIWRR